ncbi:MAG: AbrB/MazE/SpoVT family DNA-binding domain-containing protein [Rectinemataceae bacterium]
MELAKLTSKGQITIPVEIRRKLGLREGDKVSFQEEQGKIYFQNASQGSLRQFQDAMTGQAAQAGFESEEDVVQYIKSLRNSAGK